MKFSHYIKSVHLIAIALLFISIQSFAQPNKGFNYQAVARDANGALLANQVIGVKLTILDGVNVKYSESFALMTNQFGLFNVVVGTGTLVSGNYSTINWGTMTNPQMKVDMDPSGGSNYTSMGTSPLVSVPYALFAGNGGASGGGTLDSAYNFGGSGAGRIINANNGAVEINSSAANQATLKTASIGAGSVAIMASTTSKSAKSTIQATTASDSENVAAVGAFSSSYAPAVIASAALTGVLVAAPFAVDARSFDAGGVAVQGVNYDAAHADGNTKFAIGMWAEGFYGAVTVADDTTNGYGLYSLGDIGVTGNIWCTGTVHGAAKAFVIDHPLDPEHKFLQHFSIESNELLNIYRGRVRMDAAGEAVVEMPSYFSAANINFTYQLTAIGQAAPSLYIKNEIANNKFVVAGGVAGQEISWQVTAERNDPYVRLHPENKATELVKKSNEVGKYLRPQDYGKMPDAALFNKAKIQNSIRSTSKMSNQPKVLSEPQIK